jgi:hypothetical protein
MDGGRRPPSSRHLQVEESFGFDLVEARSGELEVLVEVKEKWRENM